MLRILAIIAPSIAASMSASSNTRKGALPPSSIAGFTTLSAASCKQLAADLGRAGEGDDAHARVVQHRADHLAGRARGNDVDDAGRHARLFQDRHQRQHGQRRIGGGLEHDRAAGGERGTDLAGGHRGRENSTASPARRRRPACAARRCARRRTARATPRRYCARPLPRTSGRTRRHRRPRRANRTAPCRSRR